MGKVDAELSKDSYLKGIFEKTLQSRDSQVFKSQDKTHEQTLH